MTFIFKTAATMKPYNNKKYWIDGDIISQIRISADSVLDALSLYSEIVEEMRGVIISRNAIKNREPMFKTTDNGDKQVGYILTAKTDIENTVQYIDLWVEIITVVDTEFPEGDLLA